MNKDEISRLLRHVTPADEDERQAVAAALALVERSPRPWSREEMAGHLTASAWIVNEDRSKVLLIHHRKLGLWAQPGGHIEADDLSLAAAALREVREETGLTSVRLAEKNLFDVALYNFPPRGTTPAHHHYDCRFLIIADDAEPLTCSDESHQVKWFPLEEAFAVNSQKPHGRMIRKTKAA